MGSKNYYQRPSNHNLLIDSRLYQWQTNADPKGVKQVGRNVYYRLSDRNTKIYLNSYIGPPSDLVPFGCGIYKSVKASVLSSDEGCSSSIIKSYFELDKDRIKQFFDLNKFQGAKLRGVHFLSADISGVDMSGSDLEGICLWSAHLESTNFSHANLQNADLRYARLKGAIFLGADLRWADLEGAIGVTALQLAPALLNKATVLPKTISKNMMIEAQNHYKASQDPYAIRLRTQLNKNLSP